MSSTDPSERSELARLAALSRWSKEIDRSACTQPARDAFRARFDPGPDVPEPQRSEMITAGIKAHTIRMRRAKRSAAQRKLELAEAEASA